MDTFNLFFGYFDLVVLFVLIMFNLFKRNFSNTTSCLPATLFFFLFGLLLPIISMFVEIQLNSSPGNDAFNLLYTYFRFPLYWMIGFIQFIIIYFRTKD